MDAFGSSRASAERKKANVSSARFQRLDFQSFQAVQGVFCPYRRF
jgi:hypothetical protein